MINLEALYKELSADCHLAALEAIFKAGYDHACSLFNVAPVPEPVAPPQEPVPVAPEWLNPVPTTVETAVSSEALVNINLP